MKILLAIDDSESSSAAVEAVTTQFAVRGHDVRVLHVVDVVKDLPPSLTFAEGPAAAAAVVAFEQADRRNGEDLVARVGRQLEAAGCVVTTVVRDGDPRENILDCAAGWPADLIVMGSHGRHGLGRLLLGSVSEAVLRHASCSVQVVRLRPGEPVRK